jgi:hypothetical protein
MTHKVYSARASEMFRLTEGVKQDINDAKHKLDLLEDMIKGIDPLTEKED